MVLCARCKKRVAVVFVSRIENGETINEGICLKCARELGIKPVNDIIEKMGLSEEDLDNMDSEMEANKNGAYVFGFISNMHKNLNALNLATEKEFRDLHSHIKTRFEIGNELFGILQEVQHFY